MSEFELVREKADSLGTPVHLQARELVGHLNHSFLELDLGKAESQPISSIPGIHRSEKLAAENRFGIAENHLGWRLSFQGRDLPDSIGPPRLAPANLKVLPKLLARSGDVLPGTHRHQILWDWRLPASVRVYGLGQRSSSLERRGTSPINWATDEPSGHTRSTDPLYQAHPLLWAKSEGVWWAVLFLHTSYSRFDLAQTTAEVMTWQTLGPTLRLQVHAGFTPAQVLASLKQVLELPSAPPRWALGFHQSRWGYKTRAEVDQLLDEFRSRQLPLDVVHLDIDHMQGYRSFTFDPLRFPEPREMIQNWRERGVRTVCIVDPGLKCEDNLGYGALHSGLQGKHFLSDESGVPVQGFCWPDEAVFPDYSRASCREWWAEQAQFYLNAGVSGLWIDMNEPAVFDKPFWTGGAKQRPLPLNTPCGEDKERKPFVESKNVYGSYMAEATELAWTERDERPWVLTRSGFTGVGHHAWSWMGDNSSWWEHLAMSIPQLASMGLVGSPFCGVDVGGFFGHCTAELYEAWIEAAVLYPFMRSHSAMETREQHPWSFGDRTEAIAKKALNLRYRLLPYLYSAAMEQARDPSAPPLLRPMFFDYHDDPRFDFCEDQVMLGPHLMACPFLERGKTERAVILPRGFWTDFHTGQLHLSVGDGSLETIGPAQVSSKAVIIQRDPGHLPLFIRGGGIIPTLDPQQSLQDTRELHKRPLIFHIAPGYSTQNPREEPSSNLYLDDGESSRFEEGDFFRAEFLGLPGVIRLGAVSGQPSFELPSYQWAKLGRSGWEYSQEQNLANLAQDFEQGILGKFDTEN